MFRKNNSTIYREKAVQILENMAAQLSVEDVPDFFQLALHYSDKTPECIRKDFHYIIFGANFDEEVKEIQMNKMLCLPIPAIDLTSHDEVNTPSYKKKDCQVHCLVTILLGHNLSHVLEPRG